MAGNYAKRCALMHWSFFLLNDDTTCHIWGVNNQNTATKQNIKNICLLCMYSMMLLDITSQRHIKIEAEKSCFFNGWLETMPKDAPWCTGHFSYWMTTPRVIFGDNQNTVAKKNIKTYAFYVCILWCFWILHPSDT